MIGILALVDQSSLRGGSRLLGCGSVTGIAVFHPQRCSPPKVASCSRASRAILHVMRCFDSMLAKRASRGLKGYFSGGRCGSFSASAALIMIGFPPLGGRSTIAQSSEHCGPTQP